MGRRCSWKDYSVPGIYHITMHVADALGQPFGQVVGRLDAPAGSADAPHVELSAVGAMVQHELLHAITAHYPMVQVQDYVVMPEHLHFIIQVLQPITSQQGSRQTLGHLIAGFKTGCNRSYWALTGQEAEPKPVDTQAAKPLPAPSAAAPSGSAAGVLPAGARSPKRRWSTGRQPLFAEGYVDVMPLRPGQLATQRAYIHDNPRSRLLRTRCRAWLSIQHGGIATALTPAALRGFLQRECPASACTPAILAALCAQLLMAADGTITCDTYGDRHLLAQPLLPVVCHRRDAARFQQQKARCLQAAQQGAVLVSARIAKGEQDIMDTAIAAGLPVVLITDNGFADRFHPSAERLEQCADRRLLLLTPWHYHYPYADSAITVAVCKAMNCVAQALCRQKDTWWKD